VLTSNIPGGSYKEWGLAIELNYAGPAADISYTLDGSSPAGSTAIAYTSPINISAGNEAFNIFLIKARAVEQISGLITDFQAAYILERPIALTASVEHGYHVDKTPIELTASAPGAEIYYTVDGSDVFGPNGILTNGAALYTAPIMPPSNEFYLRAAAVSDYLLPTAEYSNLINNYYRYEDDILFLDASPAGGVFPQVSLDVTLATNNDAEIKFTLDGTSPLNDSALTYQSPINLSTTLDSQTFRLRAIAISDRLISQPIDASYTLYNYNSDADKDEIPNGLEGGPETDTDSDGQPDMLDIDSDNDGMPDYLEGTVDADANNIPAFQDPTEQLLFWYSITGLPEDGALINGKQYEIKVLCYGGVGHLEIISEHPALIFSEANTDIQPGEEKIIHMYVPEVMENKCSPLWHLGAFPVRFIMSHLEGGVTVSEETLRNYSTIAYTSEIPYRGNLVVWEKVNNASSYNIYRKNIGETDFERIDFRLHDSYHTHQNTQQYLDRTGEVLSQYRISAVISGVETKLSNIMHASNCVLDYCTVSGHLSNINNKPMPEIRVTARLDKPVFMRSNTLANAYELHTYTDAFGQFNLDLPKGSVCILKIEQAGLREKLEIPMMDFIDLEDLIRLNKGE